MVNATIFAAVLAACAALGVRTASAAPAPAPSASPAPQPTATPYLRFLAIDLNLAPTVHNEFDAGEAGRTAQTVRAVAEYRFLGRNFAELAYRRWNYPHAAGAVGIANGTPCAARGGPAPSVGDPGCVTAIGGRESAFVNPARLTDQEVELRTSVVGVGGHTYITTSALAQTNDYGYPRLHSSFGVGAERLPDLTRTFTAYAGAYYFPEVTGKATVAGRPLPLRYKLTTYQAGLAFTVAHSPLFFELGAAGERYTGKQNAPGDVSRSTVNLGAGARF